MRKTYQNMHESIRKNMIRFRLIWLEFPGAVQSNRIKVKQDVFDHYHFIIKGFIS